MFGQQRTGVIDIGAEQTNYVLPAPTIDNIEGGNNRNLIIIKSSYNKAKVKSFKIYVSNQSKKKKNFKNIKTNQDRNKKFTRCY
jgi:hypothetical protein